MSVFDTQKHLDPEMSEAAKLLAAKLLAAKQPRGAGGRFGATTNEVEAKMAQLEDELRLLMSGHAGGAK